MLAYSTYRTTATHQPPSIGVSAYASEVSSPIGRCAGPSFLEGQIWAISASCSTLRLARALAHAFDVEQLNSGCWGHIMRFQFRLITIFLLMSIVGLIAWRIPYSANYTTAKSAWDHHDFVIQEVDQLSAQQMRNVRNAVRGAATLPDNQDLQDDLKREQQKLDSLKESRQLAESMKRDPQFRIQRTLRRTWLGKPVNHGKLAVLDAKGKRLRVENWDNGQREGEFTDWYPTGETLMTGQFLNGEKHGKWIQFSLSGTQSERNYEHGRLINEVENRGSWRSVGIYKNNKLQRRIVYINGVKQRESQYRDGVLHGWVREWLPRGNDQLTQEITYKNGKRHGPFRSWYPNGDDHITGQYSDDAEHGEWTIRIGQGDVKTYRFEAGQLLDAQGQPLPPLHGTFGNAEWGDSLNQESRLEMEAATLTDAIDFLATVHELRIWPHPSALKLLEQNQIQKMAPISVSGDLDFVVQLMLEPLDLWAFTYREMLIVVPLDDARSWQDETGVTQLVSEASPMTRETLNGTSMLPTDEETLSELMRMLTQRHDLKVEFAPSVPAETLKFEGAPVFCSLGTMLYLILDELGLKCTWDGDVMRIEPR